MVMMAAQGGVTSTRSRWMAMGGGKPVLHGLTACTEVLKQTQPTVATLPSTEDCVIAGSVPCCWECHVTVSDKACGGGAVALAGA
jgi:hypothetical protein